MNSNNLHQTRVMRVFSGAAWGFLASAVLSCGGDGEIFDEEHSSWNDEKAPSAVASRLNVPGPSAVMIGAGDISSCDNSYDSDTALLLGRYPDVPIFLAGDNVYPTGSLSQFTKCFDPTWGKYKARILPTVGNHEYGTPKAKGYFDYFGAAAGDRDKGYYSYDLGAWHILALNSNCEQIGGCDRASKQGKWMEADLLAHPAKCTLAIWHHPRFSSGAHGNNSAMQPLWDILYAHDADLVINGHEHDYERFAPQTPSGVRDLARGMREIVIGNGGRGLIPMKKGLANTEVRNATTFGILKLTLNPTSYEWEFIPVKGGKFADKGSWDCH